MPARPGNWQLLGHGADPVAGDPDQLHDLIAYYAKIAETIKSEAAVLQRIGSGDTTELKGQSADAIRNRSRDVAKSLTQTSGRYDAVSRALSVYGPALDAARTDSAKALQEAEAAEGAKGSSSAMPDPGANRPADAPPLTDDENAQIHARSTAISEASDAAAGARRRMDAALSSLNAAGQGAASVIRAAWNDGLVDTRAYKLREGFLKFLKVLVKVLMWIGVALAVLAFFVPGLAALAIAGAAVAVMSLAASTVLAAMGEGSWLDVIIGAVSVLLLGVGALIAKVVQTAHVAALARGAGAGGRGSVGTGGAITTNVVKARNIAANARNVQFARQLKGKITTQQALQRIAKIDSRLNAVTTKFTSTGAKAIIDKAAIKPQWWNIRTKGWWPNDLAKLKEFGDGKKYRFDRLFSTDRVGDLKKLQATLQLELGVVPKAIPVWYYFQAGRVSFGLAAATFKIIMNPTGAPGDTSRFPVYEAGKTTLTTPRP